MFNNIYAENSNMETMENSTSPIKKARRPLGVIDNFKNIPSSQRLSQSKQNILKPKENILKPLNVSKTVKRKALDEEENEKILLDRAEVAGHVSSSKLLW